MKLSIRRDGSGSSVDIFDVEPVISVNDATSARTVRHQPVTGYVTGQLFRSLRVQGVLYTLAQWEAIAYAAWLDRRLRRDMYADVIPDVGESWTASKGGAVIGWPDWMTASWESDLDHAEAILNGKDVVTNP